jgi:glycosyltransferase involved in cell wall biosynthesis
MKIAFVLPGEGRSGGVRCTVLAANGLLDRGHSVRIVYQRERLASVDWLRSRWLALRYPAGGASWLRSFRGAYESFRDIRQCRFEAGELVIGAGLSACRELSRVDQPGIRKVHYLHGEVPWDREFMKAAWGEQVPKIGVASYLDSLVHDLCGQRLHAVVPNGIDAAEYFPVLDGPLRTAAGTVFGGGRHKDPETVIAVLERLRRDCPDVPRVVFGADARPKALDGHNYVRFPSVAKARELYSRSLVWFLASRSEGFGSPILEAMACGCAVVATDCGGPRDIISEGVNGFLVPVGDVDRMVDRIQLLLKDRATRERIVANARQTVQQLTWKHSVDLLEKALQSIGGGSQ